MSCGVDVAISWPAVSTWGKWLLNLSTMMYSYLNYKVGGDGAGHFVKMVHNGIEYGDMQVS